MVPFLPVKTLLKIAKLHHIQISSHIPKLEIIRSFNGHNCASCDLYFSVFAVVHSESFKARSRMRALRLSQKNSSSDSNAQIAPDSHKHPPMAKPLDDKLETLETKAQILFPPDPMLEPVEYPPSPFDDTQLHKIITNFCAKSNKTSIEEAGCGVCGQLVPAVQLTRIKAVRNLLKVLEVPDVTRIQRKKESEPVRGYKGPVLDYSCESICDGCRQHLRNGKVPRNSLANGLWLGTVPEELACLGFIEKLLVARVRMNRLYPKYTINSLHRWRIWMMCLLSCSQVRVSLLKRNFNALPSW